MKAKVKAMPSAGNSLDYIDNNRGNSGEVWRGMARRGYREVQDECEDEGKAMVPDNDVNKDVNNGIEGDMKRDKVGKDKEKDKTRAGTLVRVSARGIGKGSSPNLQAPVTQQ